MPTGWGTGLPTQISLDGSVTTTATVITAPYFSNFSVTNAPSNTYAAAAGFDVERGHFVTIAADVWDISAFADQDTRMTGREMIEVILTYVDGDTRTWGSVATDNLAGKIKVMPLFQATPEISKISWGGTDLGPTLGESTATAFFPGGEKTSGLGRFYWHGAVGIEQEFILPDSVISSDQLASINKVGSGDIVVTRPDGSTITYASCTGSFNRANEDASNPRSTRLRVVGTAASWGALLTWSGTSEADRVDFFDGFRFEVTMRAFDESDIITEG